MIPEKIISTMMLPMAGPSPSAPANDNGGNDNPISGLKPNYDAFGGAFHNKALIVLGGIWGVFILIAIYRLMRGVLEMGDARDGSPQAYRHARGAAKGAAIALGALIAIPTLVGAIIWIATL